MLEFDVWIGYTCVRAAICEENSVCRSLNRVGYTSNTWQVAGRVRRARADSSLFADPFGPQLGSLRSDAAVGVVTARVYDG